MGIDPRGHIALNLYDARRPNRDLVFVLGVRPGRDDWSKWQDHPSLSDPSIRALALHRGVVLVSRVTEQNAQVHGYDVATGRLLWQRRFGIESLTVPQHPGCAVGKGDTFVVTGRWIPLVLDARTGRSLAQMTYQTCMKIDPVGATGVYGGSGRGGAVVAVNLTNGRQRFAIETERVDALRLELVSVYDSRIYVITDLRAGVRQRLVLDAATGKEVARDWTLAPVEHHDGWIVAYDPDRDANVVIRDPS
jgi:outer membrane protein assembly factor BamB